MIEVITGRPGSGKTFMLAYEALQKLEYAKKKGNRQVWSNIKFSRAIEEKYKGYLFYWSNLSELLNLERADVLMDEVSNYLDATQWANVPLDVKRLFRQHRKDGLNILGTDQNFLQVDISVRRLAQRVYVCKKLFGSQNPKEEDDYVKRVYGVIWVRALDPEEYDKEKPKYSFSDYYWIRRSITEAYDTTQKIGKAEYPPYQHFDRFCSDPSCGFHKVIHS